MFLLTKWYLDLVGSDGEVVILYEARLRWGALRARYAALLVDEPRGRHVEESTTRGIRAPRAVDGCIVWLSDKLDVEGSWSSDSAPISRMLAAGPSGSIEWSCEIPRGRASVRCGGVAYDGTGYVERLTLTIPPWKLPFRTLRWGRHTSDRHSLIWIDWDGPEHRCWVWLDGREQLGASVADSGVPSLATDTALHMTGARDVRDSQVLTTIASALPEVARRAAGPLAGMHEHKCVERSALVRVGKPLDSGWTLHEQVTW